MLISVLNTLILTCILASPAKFKFMTLNKSLQQFIVNLKERFALYGSLSLAVFLFVLFFQPFSVGIRDFNNVLIFTAGLGIIILVLLVLCNLIFRGWIKRQENDIMVYLHGITLLMLSSVALAFYLRYVGQVRISFPVMIRVILICLIPPLCLRLFGIWKDCRQRLDRLEEENTSLRQKITTLEGQEGPKTIEFSSGFQGDTIRLSISDIILVKSADNYVEILYTDGNALKKKLLRNTLNHIEQQLKPFAPFIRCHRTFIINIDHTSSIIRRMNSYQLTFRDLDEQVPISRQYLLKVKELLAARQG